MLAESIIQDSSNLDNIKVFERLFVKELGENEPADIILDKLAKGELISKLLSTSAWVCFGDYVPKKFCHISKQMVGANAGSIKEYFLDNITLNELGVKLRSGGIRDFSILDRDSVIKDIMIGKSIINTDLNWKISRSLQGRSKVKILGFGSGSCSELINLKKFLLESKTSEEVELFCYDPYNRSNIVNEVTYVDRPAHKKGLEYDLIISRWVLHHVENRFRWDKLISFVNNLSNGGELYILEEGDLVTTEYRGISKKLYYLILLLIDIVINSVLHPGWLSSNEGKDFFVKYIEYSDLVKIEEGIKFPFDKTSGRLGSGQFFSQVYFRYKRIV